MVSRIMSQFRGKVLSDLIYHTYPSHNLDSIKGSFYVPSQPFVRKRPSLFTTKRPTCYAQRTPPSLQDAAQDTTISPLGICFYSLHRIPVAYFSVSPIHCLFCVFCFITMCCIYLLFCLSDVWSVDGVKTSFNLVALYSICQFFSCYHISLQKCGIVSNKY